MKNIVIKRPKVKLVPVETDEIEMIEKYQTPDGVIFDQLSDAVIHESELRIKDVEKSHYWFPVIGDIWYKAKDEGELRFLKNHLAKTFGHRYGEDRLKVGEWFTVKAEDRDGNGNFADHFVPLSKFIEDYKKLLEQLEGK